MTSLNAATQAATATNTPVSYDPSQAETKLPPAQEAQFMPWLTQQHDQGYIPSGDYNYYQQKGYGYDYDFRAAFANNVKPVVNPTDGKWHWNDIGKKPNEPTFSKQSKWAKGAFLPYAGTWDGDTYVPSKQGPLNWSE